MSEELGPRPGPEVYFFGDGEEEDSEESEEEVEEEVGEEEKICQQVDIFREMLCKVAFEGLRPKHELLEEVVFGQDLGEEVVCGAAGDSEESEEEVEECVAFEARGRTVLRVMQALSRLQVASLFLGTVCSDEVLGLDSMEVDIDEATSARPWLRG